MHPPTHERHEARHEARREGGRRGKEADAAAETTTAPTGDRDRLACVSGCVQAPDARMVPRAGNGCDCRHTPLLSLPFPCPHPPPPLLIRISGKFFNSSQHSLPSFSFRLPLLFWPLLCRLHVEAVAEKHLLRFILTAPHRPLSLSFTDSALVPHSDHLCPEN